VKDIAYIYFMANTYNTVLYVGVTNDLVRRVAEHKAKINKGFTYKYNVDKLVYFEEFNLMTDAIAREKQIKNWKREWKDALINTENPEWKDLSDSIGIDEEYVMAVREHYQGIAGQARNDEATTSQARNDVSAIAKQHAENEFEKYRPIQDRLFESDFDKAMKMLGNKDENE
jgi:putative endonuclease